MRLWDVTLLCLYITACSAPPESSASRYQRWLEAGNHDQASAYEAYLHAQGLDRVIPMPELLRSGRHWHECNTSEFAVPPRKEWGAMVPTLRLVGELETAGVLAHAEVASAWRSPVFNRCEGGSSESRHLSNNALDFDIVNGISVSALCAYWHENGARRRFGLGFYSSGKIHVDTSGFRTWGYDHHGGTSLCVRRTDQRMPG